VKIMPMATSTISEPNKEHLLTITKIFAKPGRVAKLDFRLQLVTLEKAGGAFACRRIQEKFHK
jgi:hypothetical protein